MIKDEYLKAYGHFKIETLDLSGNVIDQFEDNNLIVDLARVNMCELISGINVGVPINKFVLGTSGHIGTNILEPKTSSEGFLPTRTQLFSEELATYIYPVVFEGAGANGLRTIVSEPSSAEGSSTITVTQVGTEVTYEVYLPSEVGNNTGTVAYTEAGFYCGTQLFNLKTFAAKVKSASVTIKITWKISF